MLRNMLKSFKEDTTQKVINTLNNVATDSNIVNSVNDTLINIEDFSGSKSLVSEEVLLKEFNKDEVRKIQRLNINKVLGSNLESYVSRGEVARLVYTALASEGRKGVKEYKDNYKDIFSYDEFYSPIKGLYEMNILAEDSNKTFNYPFVADYDFIVEILLNSKSIKTDENSKMKVAESHNIVNDNKVTGIDMVKKKDAVRMILNTLK